MAQENTTNDDPLKELRKYAEKWLQERGEQMEPYRYRPPYQGCPNCGYCPHCGRGGRQWSIPSPFCNY